MTLPELGTLVEVNLREAWHHEAHSFTPWLAEHLDSLAKVIDIPLELKGREVAVETFSADILARNPIDDSLVLIENQLEGTDHSHLGQIMTYLAGLGAHTVVWIAADFREPHLSALKWLNENTVEPFAFFAVKVRAVRIGDSPIAPIFEVVGKPNHWERQLQTIAKRTGTLSTLGQFRKNFWTHYVNRFPDELEWYPADATNARWRTFEDYELVVASYLTKNGVGVYIRGLRGVEPLDYYDILAPHADRLTTLLGVGIEERGYSYLFTNFKEGDTSDPQNWDALADWLHSAADSYEAALQEIFG